MHILVVDDNDVNRLLASAVLKSRGWTVTQASGGLEAMVKLEQQAFDAVLLDVSMPHLAGDSLCEWIRADERMGSMPVIAYTAHAMPDEVSRYRDMGFDDVVCKPASGAQIVAAIESHARRAA